MNLTEIASGWKIHNKSIKKNVRKQGVANLGYVRRQRRGLRTLGPQGMTLTRMSTSTGVLRDATKMKVQDNKSKHEKYRMHVSSQLSQTRETRPYASASASFLLS